MNGPIVMKSGDVQRYSPAERVLHTVVALSFLSLAGTGLAFFHPLFWPLAGVQGGGQWSRIAHPYIGLVMVFALGILCLRVWAENIVRPHDIAWGKHLRRVINNDMRDLPEVGKYNLGQKQLFWALVATSLLLLGSGLLMWHSLIVMPGWVVRIAATVHAIAAFLMLLGIIVHVYAAVFWIKGSMRAMTRGTVTRAWAKHHHPLWYKEITGSRE